jgi:hypothetical protein
MPVPVNGMTLMLPAATEPAADEKRLRVTVDGQPCATQGFAAFDREFVAVPLRLPVGEYVVAVSA